ncbi:hypothetical protein PMZ80_006922 [Knufia obscura]|uniref:Uncharacterized protein n=2 Tax=Knufia TaxID=430999 RepID=A0AAN8ES23_9EURO|nr:hypothetical protein PMZ80_006922 [Knufia obscura]KAK5957462.1 hypothetical protein OHC33_001837 [Knufia fluminis]
MPHSDPQFGSSSPYSPPSSYHGTMQEQDLSDNESMAMSVDSSPSYSPPSSSRSLKRASLDIELTIRKRRRTSTNDFDLKCSDMQSPGTSPTAQLQGLSQDSYDHQMINPARLALIQKGADSGPTPAPVSADPRSPVSKRAQKLAQGTSATVIQGQMNRLQNMLDKIRVMDADHMNAPQTWAALQKRIKKLGEGLMHPHKDVGRQSLEEARGLKSQAEAYVHHNRVHFERLPGSLEQDESSDEDSDGVTPLAWKSRPLKSGAILATPDDDQPFKRRKLSSTESHSEYDGFRQISYGSTTSSAASTFTSFASSGSIATETEIEDFLSDLSDDIQASTLKNLCPDNMRGTFCHKPDECHTQGRFFACPEYAVLKKCPHEKENSLTHIGYKHTINGCTAHHKADCKRTHKDGRPCRVKVVYFHVRASCMTLRGGKKCQMTPCQWGHDFESIRRAVMKI